MKVYLTERQVAARWRMSKRTLTNWRWKGVGPKFDKFGHSVLYHVADIQSFELRHGKPPRGFSREPHARGH